LFFLEIIKEKKYEPALGFSRFSFFFWTFLFFYFLCCVRYYAWPMNVVLFLKMPYGKGRRQRSMDILVLQSAHKHGITEESIYSCLFNCRSDIMLEEIFHNRLVVIHA